MVSSVVKSRLQAGHAKYKSAVDGILSIMKNEGVGGIYKGVGNKLIQSVLTAAILFVGQKRIYEVIKVSIPFCRTSKSIYQSIGSTSSESQALTVTSLKKVKRAV